MFEKILLCVDAYESEAVPRGSMGYIIEAYLGNKYEVEFSDPNGTTIAQLVLDKSEFIISE